MGNNHDSKSGVKWCSIILGVIGMVVAVVHLAALLYFAATIIMFLTKVGLASLPGFVVAAIMTAVSLTAILLAIRYAGNCIRYGMQDDRVKELFPSECFALVLQFIYLGMGLVLLFVPFLDSISTIQLQIFFGVFFIFLIHLAIMVVIVLVSGHFRGQPEKEEGRGRALWSSVKTAVLWGVLGALSVTYIFSGQRSIVGTKTDAFQKFSAADLSGTPVDQEILEGYDLTLINVWGTFCGPCLNEMPDLAELHEEYRDRGFQVVGVCGDIVDMQTGEVDQELLKKALELEKQTGADVYLNINPAGDIMENYISKYVSAYPSTVFVNKKGEQVGDMIVGSCDKESWVEEIEKRFELLKGEKGD